MANSLRHLDDSGNGCGSLRVTDASVSLFALAM
jgi:hypothetical protein